MRTLTHILLNHRIQDIIALAKRDPMRAEALARAVFEYAHTLPACSRWHCLARGLAKYHHQYMLERLPLDSKYAVPGQ